MRNYVCIYHKAIGSYPIRAINRKTSRMTPEVFVY